jgi:Flp pilus assembly protein CpaB
MASGGRRRGLIFIIIALVIIAVLAVVFLLSRGTQLLLPGAQPGASTAPQASEKMTTIVITTQRIPRGSVITEGVITTLAYPEKDLVTGTFFTNPKDVLNKQAKYDLEARIPITEGMLVTGQVGSYAAFQIPKGYVAVSIPITKLTAVSFAPVVGDHVNIIASVLVVDTDQNTQSVLPNLTGKAIPPSGATETDPGSLTVTSTTGGGAQGRVDLDTTLNQPVYLVPSEPQRPRLVSQMVIQDAIILRVGSFPTNELAKTSGVEPTPGPQPASGAAEATPVPAPDMMTLIVRPQDAITLNYLMLSSAQLSLALRSAGDLEPAVVEAVTLQYLFQTYNIPNPPKTAFGLNPRKDTLEFNSKGTSSVVPTAVPQ